MTAPGWHPDPWGGKGLRYHDGNDWTSETTVQPGPKRWGPVKVILTTIAAVVGGLFLIGVIGSLAGVETQDEKDEAASFTTPPPRSPSAPVVPEPTTPTVAPVGSAVRDGKFEFQVLDTTFAKTVSDPTGNPYMTATAQGNFLVVTLSVTNIGDKPANYFGQNQKVIDTDGRVYEADSRAGMWMNTGTSIMGDINPGNSIEVKVAFDVPGGINLSALELHDSMFSGGVKVALA
jgi:hypothetical protein